MRIINNTKKTEIANNAKLATSFFSRLQGLMMAKKPQTLVLVSPREGIECSAIHMWFMRMPLDVVWLNNEYNVVDLYEKAKPFALRTFKPKCSARYVVECPVGTIKKSKTSEGDIISFRK